MRRRGLAASAEVLVGTALAGILLCAASRAQVRVSIPSPGVSSEDRHVTAELTGVTGAARPCGSGHVRVDLRNPDSTTHRVSVVLADPYSGVFRATAVAEVEPGAEVRLFLPLPSIQMQATLRLAVDGGPSVPGASFRTTSDDGVGLAVLLIEGARTDKLGWTAMLERRVAEMPHASSHGRDPRQIPVFESLRPVDLPPDWTGISGFDLVVVDGRADGLDERAQRVLLGYVRAGGQLLVASIDVMPRGLLRDAVEAGGVVLGFGTAYAVDSSIPLPGANLRFDVERSFARWLRRGDGPLRPTARPTSGPLPPGMLVALDIPGLGRVPLRAFFVLILVFALVVGPVNYFYWRRRRRLPMLLLTVPAIGLLTTAVLLGYGFLAEGLGVKGTLRSLTVLDQVERTAVSWSTRTLYAGLSPNRIVPRAGTSVTTPHIFGRSFGRADHVLHFAPDGSLDGGLLPSRTPTTLGVVSQGPERARLRFERQGDGTLVVLAGPELAPAPGVGDLLLRDLDGGSWMQRSDGRLERCRAEDLESRLLELVGGALAGQDFDQENWGLLPLGMDWEHEGPAARFILACAADSEAALAPGHYVVRLASPSPAVDDLGLDAELIRRELVLGRIGAEDVLD